MSRQHWVCDMLDYAMPSWLKKTYDNIKSVRISKISKISMQYKNSAPAPTADNAQTWCVAPKRGVSFCRQFSQIFFRSTEIWHPSGPDLNAIHSSLSTILESKVS